MNQRSQIKKLMVLLAVIGFVMVVSHPIEASVYSDGGDRLIQTQNADGGWGWPLNGSSASNTAAPIAMGLLASYAETGQSKYLDAATKAGDYIKAVSPPHSTANGIFMDALSEATGDSQYAEDVKTEFYDALAAGTYVKNSVSYNTAGYAQYLLNTRTSQGIHNLATWDLALATIGAYRLNADTTDWVSVLESSINSMNSIDYYDVIGLAGGVWALAELGLDFDPTAGAYASAGSLSDLAGILAGYQLNTGGFTWNSQYVVENDGNETVQETAYSILALNTFDPISYVNEISSASNYLSSVQLGTGGWEDYLNSGENNEITGEALWSQSAAVPEPSTCLLFIFGLVGMVGIKKKFN